MVYVKTISRSRKDGSIRKHYYLAKNYRENGKSKTKIVKRINKETAEIFNKCRDKKLKDVSRYLKFLLKEIDGEIQIMREDDLIKLFCEFLEANFLKVTRPGKRKGDVWYQIRNVARWKR